TERIEAHRIRIADAHPDEPIESPNAADDSTPERAPELCLELPGRCLKQRDGVAAHRETELGRLALVAVEQVDDATDVLELLSDPFPDLVELGVVRAEDLDLDRPGTSGQIVQDVLQHLDELDAELGHGAADALPQIGDDLVGRALAVRARLKADHHVAAI